MNIRAHRRDLNVADRYLWFQSKVDRLKEQMRARSTRAKRYTRAKLDQVHAKLADMPIKLSQLGAQRPAETNTHP